MDPKDLDPLYYNPDIIIDTVALSQRVRYYLTYNQIKWERFGRLVLGIGQARLSVLLGHPKPWSALRLRVKTYYQRMLEWMETRATYGNNPHMKYKKKKLKRLIKPKRKVPVQRFRGLFQWDTGRSEMEMQNAIDYLSRMNKVQQGLQNSGSNIEETLNSGTSGFNTQTIPQMHEADHLDFSFSSDEEDLTGMELEVEDDDDENILTDLAADLDDMVNKMDLPELAEIDMDILNPENLLYKYPGLSITRVEPATTSHNQVSASHYEESTSDSFCEIKITGTHSIGLNDMFRESNNIYSSANEFDLSSYNIDPSTGSYIVPAPEKGIYQASGSSFYLQGSASASKRDYPPVPFRDPVSYRDSVPCYLQDTVSGSLSFPAPGSYLDHKSSSGGESAVTVQAALNDYYHGLVTGDMKYQEFQDSTADEK